MAAGKVTGSRRRGGGMVRASVFVLHLVVVGVAVASLVTGGFGVWVDLRGLGQAALLLEILWVGTVVLVPFCAGPWPVGMGRWRQQGYLGAWTGYLLWPTYGVMAALLVNSVWYVKLRLEGRADWQVPATVVAFGVLALWVLLTREWLRRQEGMAAAERAKGWKVVGTVLAGVLMALVAVGGVVVHGYRKTMPGRVDAAVVLGGRVNGDGTASVELAQRVRAATGLYKAGRVETVVLSGAIMPARVAGGPVMDEVGAMKAVCLEEGVPEGAIVLDPVGVNTRATAWNTVALMKARGWKSVVACTTPFHLYRTAQAFKEAMAGETGMEMYTAGARPVDWICANPRDVLRELGAIVVYDMSPTYREPVIVKMKLNEPRVVVSKSGKKLTLLDGQRVVKTYACITGGKEGDKEKEGDRKTPVGTFRIVFKNPESKFHLSLGLDYPNAEDAARGLAGGLITKQQHDDILAALGTDLSVAENQKKLWYTPLGGEIFLHGHGEGRAGTAGCVALSNGDIEELYAVLPLGTVVVIEP